jgi:sugar O-acyltransferase (sialic acid O-acetyltransferase NeuD family)
MRTRHEQPETARPIILIGGGGHALVVADASRASRVPVLGFADDEPSASVAGVDRLGTIEDVLSDERFAVNPLILAMGLSTARTRLSVRLSGRPPARVIHPSAIISDSARIGGGSFIGPGAIVNAQAITGAHAIVNSGAIVEHECVVGDGAHVCPRAVMGGRARLGERATLGTGAVVLPGVSIGDGAVVGASSLVNRDVPSGETVAGVPARALARGA